MLFDKIHSALPHLNIYANRPLSELCTLRTGGNAEVFTAPDNIDDIRAIFSLGCPVYVFGGGSNVLFPDGLISGVVISTLNLKAITWHDEFTADIDSGFMLPALMKVLRDKGLGGLEFAAGIPGTLGGALSGNAGAGGRGVCEFIDEVVTIESNGEIRTWHRDEIAYSYRKCSLSDKQRVIISARMTFRKADPNDKNIYENFMLKRKNQPHSFGNAGCTFKNPEGYSAGKLLDEAGCKNLCVGDAVVSDIHANFILNRGHASSSDIMELMKICAARVYENTGITLEPEIRILGV